MCSASDVSPSRDITLSISSEPALSTQVEKLENEVAFFRDQLSTAQEREHALIKQHQDVVLVFSFLVLICHVLIVLWVLV